MTAFVYKRIAKKMLGEQLRAAREEAGFALEMVAHRLKIRVAYLQALEASHYDVLPSEVFIRGFLKSYARFLHLSEKRVLHLYEGESRLYRKRSLAKRDKHLFTMKRRPSFVFARIARVFAAGAFVFAIVFYLGFEVASTFAPPVLHITSPSDNLVTRERAVTVTGTTTPESEVMLNGKLVSVDDTGSFVESVILHDGLNTLEITSKKGHSRVNSVNRYVVVDAKVAALDH